MPRVFRVFGARTERVGEFRASEEVPSPSGTHTAEIITDARKPAPKQSPLDRNSSLAEKLSAMLKGQ